MFSWSVYIFFISKIHPNTEIREQNPSPSKVVTFLYVGKMLAHVAAILVTTTSILVLTYVATII